VPASPRHAAPLEDEKDKKAREDANFAAMNQLFDAYVQNDQTILPAAIRIFNEFVRRTKPKVITDRRYYLNLMHLVFVAFEVLRIRGGELPRIEGESYGQWFGKLADRWCFAIVAAAIQSDLPHRQKQILSSGVHYLFNNNKKAARVLDVSGALFSGAGTDYLFGVNSYYYDIGGYASRRTDRAWRRAPCAASFQNLLRAITSASKIYYSAATNSFIEPVI